MTDELVPASSNAAVLFPGATAADMIVAATDVAGQFSDVVRRQGMYKRIGSSDHIRVEAWQTIAALTGVAATEAGGVYELAWRHEPPEPGELPADAGDDAMRAWELRRDIRRAWELGRAFGFRAAMRATKNGVDLGWGQGLVDRTEPNWTNKADHELQAMAQTRALSRALSVPLRWTVKLAGYDPTPAEELDGTPHGTDDRTPTATDAPAAPWGPVANSELEERAAAAVKVITAHVDAERFILDLGSAFDGVPVAAARALIGLAKAIVQAKEPDPPPAAQGPPDDVVYPPGRYQGD